MWNRIFNTPNFLQYKILFLLNNIFFNLINLIMKLYIKNILDELICKLKSSFKNFIYVENESMYTRDME